MDKPVQIRTISSPSGEYRATLALSYARYARSGEGIEVTLWHRDEGKVGQWVLTCPWHVALDEVHAIVARLDKGGLGPRLAEDRPGLFNPDRPGVLVYDDQLGRVVQIRRR
jgi:hypothetical protein